MYQNQKIRRVFMTDRGCPGMATAGSGDVLSGILSAVCANAEDLTLAAAVGAYINGAAGELAQSRRSAVTMTAADTASAVAEIIERSL
jgi:NAD(P)H-hydrate epimerase